MKKRVVIFSKFLLGYISFILVCFSGFLVFDFVLERGPFAPKSLNIYDSNDTLIHNHLNKPKDEEHLAYLANLKKLQ
jgi:hypothetical protein